MCSPVLHKMICGSFIESNGEKLELKDVDGPAFRKTLDIWCGKQNCSEMELGDLKEVASVADRFQMTDVVSLLNNSIRRQLNMRM